MIPHYLFDILMYSLAIKAILVGSCVNIPASLRAGKIVRNCQ